MVKRKLSEIRVMPVVEETKATLSELTVWPPTRGAKAQIASWRDSTEDNVYEIVFTRVKQICVSPLPTYRVEVARVRRRIVPESGWKNSEETLYGALSHFEICKFNYKRELSRTLENLAKQLLTAAHEHAAASVC